MKCLECNGLGLIHIPAVPEIHKRYDMVCPTCEGLGELPDPSEFPNNCPACGEPIRSNEKWCVRSSGRRYRHKLAEQFEIK